MNRENSTPWNVIVVVADTVRPKFLGCYGNEWMQTPCIDQFAQESTRFTRAHPECLPTIPTRRTLHSGRRAFPFNDYQPVPWDNVYLPGWQPMSAEESTIAETLQQAGYQTGFVADVPHYFVPGMNFTRGFRQWEFIRGQAEDRWNAVAKADPALLRRYRAASSQRIAAHLVNVRPEQPEEEWPTARLFRRAIRFLEDNQGAGPLYLYVDSFSPHETWEAPLHYYDLYGSRAQREPVCLTVSYGPYAAAYADRIPSIRANYAGLVTMLDTWFGRLLDTVDRLGMRENSLIFFLSDHGTNFADNPEGVMGKPADRLFPGTMDIPLLVRHPAGTGGGQIRNELVYTLDVPATILAATQQQSVDPVEGQNLLPLLEGCGGFIQRDYLTCRYGNSVWYRDNHTWFFSNVYWENPRVFDLETDSTCQVNIADRSPDRIALARQRILMDAGGRLDHYMRQNTTDALGRPEFAKA